MIQPFWLAAVFIATYVVILKLVSDYAGRRFKDKGKNNDKP